MCLDEFVAVDTHGYDSLEFRTMQGNIESAAWANFAVLQGILGVAELEGIARNCLGSYDPDWETWFFDVKCINCGIWGTVRGPVGVGVAIAHVAKRATDYDQLLDEDGELNDGTIQSGFDVSEYLLD